MIDLSFINFLMLGDEERGTKAEQRLGDLREQAQAIARRTGHEPLTFMEFQAISQRDAPQGSSFNSAFKGAIIGGSTFAAISGLLTRSTADMVRAGGFGVFLGAALGAFHNTRNDSRGKLVEGYAGYLGQFAKQLAAGLQPGESYGQYLFGDYAAPDNRQPGESYGQYLFGDSYAALDNRPTPRIQAPDVAMDKKIIQPNKALS